MSFIALAVAPFITASGGVAAAVIAGRAVRQSNAQAHRLNGHGEGESIEHMRERLDRAEAAATYAKGQVEAYKEGLDECRERENELRSQLEAAGVLPKTSRRTAAKRAAKRAVKRGD